MKNSEHTSSPGFWQDLKAHWNSQPLGPLLYRHFKAWWWRIPPDPWSKEVEADIQGADAEMVCHHCMEPYAEAPDFCNKCGTAIGPYNNVLPFERIFSIGEMFRNGVGPHPNLKPLTILGYILIAPLQYGIFFPVYLFRMIRNRRSLNNKFHKPPTSFFKS